MKLLLAGGLTAALCTLFLEDTHQTTTSTSAGGAVQVQVTWDGDIPDALAALSIDGPKSVGCCAEGTEVDSTNRTRRISADGGVADLVFTFAPKGHEVEVELREEPVVLDQEECRFEPHILPIHVGETLRYKNSDSVNHNVNVRARKNGSFNRNVPAGDHHDVLLEEVERVTVACDIHPWMAALVFVTDVPYVGTTSLDGSLSIEGLAPGTYEVEWWHETLGKGDLDDITVTEGGTVEIEHEVKESSGGGRRRRR